MCKYTYKYKYPSKKCIWREDGYDGDDEKEMKITIVLKKDFSCFTYILNFIYSIMRFK